MKIIILRFEINWRMAIEKEIIIKGRIVEGKN